MEEQALGAILGMGFEDRDHRPSSQGRAQGLALATSRWRFPRLIRSVCPQSAGQPARYPHG